MRAHKPHALIRTTATGGGGRAARTLRLLLLVVWALAAVEFLLGFVFDASPIRTYLYKPVFDAMQPSVRITEKTVTWAKKLSTTATVKKGSPITVKTESPINSTSTPSGTSKVNFEIPIVNSSVANITAQNMTKLKASKNTLLLIEKFMKNIMNYVTEGGDAKRMKPASPLCEIPPDLGPILANKTEMELEDVEKKFPEVHWGGRYSPRNCTARHKVAIIVPFRDRKQHLAIFLNHMHSFLMRQQIEYGIFIVEQKGNSKFNRGKLMNVGYAEVHKQKSGGWQCFIFHDVDLLPLDERNMYSCPTQPRHMSASVDKFNFQLPYEDIFGGVSVMTNAQFEAVNGFSNKYWGWGGEDDDMSYRLTKMGFYVARYKMSIARYAMLDHKTSPRNPKRFQLLSETGKMFLKDGLSTLEYEVVQVIHNHLYTHVLVNIDERS